MNLETALTFSAVAGLAILSPGPAILLALRNGVTFGALGSGLVAHWGQVLQSCM